MQALGTECIQGSSAKGPLRCQGSPARSRHAQLSAARSACHGGCCWLSLEALLLVQARGGPRGLESPLSAEAAGLAASSSFLRERLAGRRPQALSPGQVAVLPFPRPRAPQAWLGLHRLSQSLVAEEPQGHRASASGSAVSEVTGGTPVLCKYRGQRGRRAGWLQPSIILARRGGGQTQHHAPGSKPVCFPFVSCDSAGCDRLPVSSCLAPSPGRRGEGRRFERLPPRHPFRTSKAPPALSVPAGSGPENVIRGGQCRAGPASALRSHWGPWIPPFAASTTLVTAPLPRASLLAFLSPGIPAGQPSPAALLPSLLTTASHLPRGTGTPRTLGAASLRPFMSSMRI